MLKMIFKLILSIDAKNINWKKSLREVIDEGKSQKYNRTNVTYFFLNLGPKCVVLKAFSTILEQKIEKSY